MFAQVGVIATSITFRTMLVLLFIVQPKINRVLSGKKVVVSNLLREQRASDTWSSGTSPIDNGERRNSHSQQPPNYPLPQIHLKRDDPLPRKLEISMYHMLEILREITRRSSEGRSLRLSDWNALCEEESKLSGWTERIELDWDTEPTTQRSIPVYQQDNGNDPSSVVDCSPPRDDEAPAELPMELSPLPDCELSDDLSVEERLRHRLSRNSSEKMNSGDP